MIFYRINLAKTSRDAVCSYALLIEAMWDSWHAEICGSYSWFMVKNSTKGSLSCVVKMVRKWSLRMTRMVNWNDMDGGNHEVEKPWNQF